MNVKKEAAKRNAMKKIIIFLATACIVLGILKFVLDTSVFNDIEMQNRMSSMLPTSVTVEDALYVKTYSVSKYLAYIEVGEYKKAYNMFTDEYKAYKSYNDYMSDIKDIDFTTFRVQEVKELSENTYVLPVEYMKNDELIEETYLVLVNKVNDKIMKISPDRFLYSLNEKLEFSKNHIKFIVEEETVYSDKIYLKVTIKNNNLFEDIDITKIGIGYNTEESKTEKVTTTIKAKDSQTFELEFSSNYDVPKYLKIEREMKEITRTYTFEL